jgi:uracil-DNA glycosylase
MYQFPFGQPLQRVEQAPHTSARVFVLGVYSSAVHARWLGLDGKQRALALAVASEPYVFWRGEGAEAIIDAIQVPPEAGSLVEAHRRFNGPSGKSLDEDYLAPLGLERDDAWLCDLLPESRMNKGQAARVLSDYAPVARALGLPAATVPMVSSRYADPMRVEAVLEELLASGAETLITLGDAPLREFVAALALGHSSLRMYGTHPGQYGKLHPFTIRGRHLQLLPLTHPRQARALGNSDKGWGNVHRHWVTNAAGQIAGLVGRQRKVS